MNPECSLWCQALSKASLKSIYGHAPLSLGYALQHRLIADGNHDDHEDCAAARDSSHPGLYALKADGRSGAGLVGPSTVPG